eukprot:6199525-Pleurochrysis_carterae.AAC.8
MARTQFATAVASFGTAGTATQANPRNNVPAVKPQRERSPLRKDQRRVPTIVPQASQGVKHVLKFPNETTGEGSKVRWELTISRRVCQLNRQSSKCFVLLMTLMY